MESKQDLKSAHCQGLDNNKGVASTWWDTSIRSLQAPEASWRADPSSDASEVKDKSVCSPPQTAEALSIRLAEAICTARPREEETRAPPDDMAVRMGRNDVTALTAAAVGSPVRRSTSAAAEQRWSTRVENSSSVVSCEDLSQWAATSLPEQPCKHRAATETTTACLLT